MRYNKRKLKKINLVDEIMNDCFEIKDKKSGRKTRVLKKIPEGWVKLNGAMTQPLGCEWFFNGKSFFSGEFKTELVVTDFNLFNRIITESRSSWQLVEE